MGTQPKRLPWVQFAEGGPWPHPPGPPPQHLIVARHLAEAQAIAARNAEARARAALKGKGKGKTGRDWNGYEPYGW